ncbi:hypothetical protein FI667_g6955, partial [Globisporangium splendens]
MDPHSRRSTWELIQNNRRKRVLILTTHFMDEADILGDRIAIMADGELKCVGSSLFLKNRFGVGYRLSFVQVQRDNHLTLGGNKDGGYAQPLYSPIPQHIPKAKVDTDIGTELTFQLPFESSSSFPALFEEIESKQQDLGVLSFAISVTTLEEIFLRVAEGTAATNGELHQEIIAGEAKVSIDDFDAAHPLDKLESSTTMDVIESRPRWFLNQIDALLRKCLSCAKRDRGMIFLQCDSADRHCFRGIVGSEDEPVHPERPEGDDDKRRTIWPGCGNTHSI